MLHHTIKIQYLAPQPTLITAKARHQHRRGCPPYMASRHRIVSYLVFDGRDRAAKKALHQSRGKHEVPSSAPDMKLQNKIKRGSTHKKARIRSRHFVVTAVARHTHTAHTHTPAVASLHVRYRCSADNDTHISLLQIAHPQGRKGKAMKQQKKTCALANKNTPTCYQQGYTRNTATTTTQTRD